MSERTTNIHARIGLIALVAVFGAMICTPAAKADFGLLPGSVATTVANDGGLTENQAGAHPNLKTAFLLNTTESGGFTVADGDLKDTRVELPPGALANPLATPRCAAEDFSPIEGNPLCATATQVGMARVLVSGVSIAPPEWTNIPLYNLAPQRGEPARLGFRLGRNNIVIDTRIRTGSDYGVTADIRNAPGGLMVYGAEVTLWGVPAASSHDPERFLPGAEFPGDAGGNPISVGITPRAFFSGPTSCGAQPLTRISVSSWQDPAGWVSDQAAVDTPTGCDAVPFPASLQVRPEQRQAGAPTGVEVAVKVDQADDPIGLSSSALKSASVTLPAGMTVNTAVADGLSGCAPIQIALTDAGSGSCPGPSKIGSVEVATPLVDHALPGSVYLATQGTNPFNSLLAMYLVISDPETGVVVKLAGKIAPDPVTGQLTATFDDNPQLPFSSLRLRLNGGDRAPLVNPQACGTYTTHAALTGWARPNEVVSSDSSFTIDQGCDKEGKFTPGFEAGTANPFAGSLALHPARHPPRRPAEHLAASTPPCPRACWRSSAGVPLCADAQAATGACPSASQVGTTTVGVGSGLSPLYVPQPGKAPTAVYLAGPYKGAPYSPGRQGPGPGRSLRPRHGRGQQRDLHVDPHSAQVTAKSDPLPQILQGIPIAYRDIRVDVDRPGFTLNPTSCDPMSVERHDRLRPGQVRQRSPPASRSPTAPSSASAPKLALSLKGGTKRAPYPALKAVLTADPGPGQHRPRLGRPAALGVPRPEPHQDDLHPRPVRRRGLPQGLDLRLRQGDHAAARPAAAGPGLPALAPPTRCRTSSPRWTARSRSTSPVASTPSTAASAPPSRPCPTPRSPSSSSP